MRFRPRTWLLLSLLLFTAAYWVWIYAEKVSAFRRARVAMPAPASVTAAPQRPVAPLAKVSQAPAPVKAKSYRLSNTRLTEKQLLRSDHAIILRNALIDTDRPLKLDIPDHLRAKGAPGSYIVQSERALDQRFYDRLARDGVKFISYIPNNAALVQATPDQARQMASDAEFQAVLPYEPYYKLATSLLPSAVEQDQPLSQALNVTAIPGQRDAALAALKALGAQLMGEDTGPFGTTLSVMVPPEKLAAVAQMPLASEIEPYTPRRVLNDLTRVTMSISTNTLYVTPNYRNLNGTSVTVNMNDTGVDSTHPDFTGNGGIRLLGATGALTDDDTGHGTHVAGIIMGNGIQSKTINSATNPIPGSVPGAGFQGKATNATLFVQSLNLGVSIVNDADAIQIGGSIISDAALQVNASSNLGPTNLISNNSWGYDANGYDLHAASFDQATRDAQPLVPGEQPLLFVFAAGGTGDGGDFGEGGNNNSILSPATAKNVITVGALDSARYITNGVTFDDMTTNDIFFDWTDNNNLVTPFSSCGNVAPGTEGTYGRFKPDVVAPGMFIISCRASNYVDPSFAYITTVYPYPGQMVAPGQTNFFQLPITTNMAADLDYVLVTVTPNLYSPTPFPDLNILADTTTPPTTILGPTTGGFFVFPNKLTAGEWYLGVTPTNGQVQPVSYDFTIYVVETNDLGVPATNMNGYFYVVSNLNSILKPNYVYENGTSMAAGAVSGMLALMQGFLNTNTLMLPTNPSPALLKAMVINGSRSAEQQYDFNPQSISANEQGWGLPNLTNCLPASLGSSSNSMLLTDQSSNVALATGQSQTYSVACNDGNATNFPMRITLVWTDPPGDPPAGLALVNNLDLVVIDNTGTNIWLGNDFYTGDIFTELNTGDLPDAINNVQNVYIDCANTPNIKFPLTVSILGMRVNVNAPTTVTNLISQDYALVISSDDSALTSPLTITSNMPTFTPPTFLATLANPLMYTNASGGPLLSSPLAAFAQSNYTLVTVLSNGVNYLHQRVGANEPNLYTNGTFYTNGFTSTLSPLGTNGNPLQWHFFIFTNNQYGLDTNTGSNMIATNFMVTTFMPPDLATQISPRTNGADLDLYVATGFPDSSQLTNLDPNVFAEMTTNFMSVSRGGSETVIDTNSQMGQVYYIGVKSEDQQGGDFGIYAVAQQAPFSTVNPDGSVTATAGPAIIPDTLDGPPAILHLFLQGTPLSPQLILRKITAVLSIAADNPADDYGVLEHNGTQVVLNNYSGPPGGFTNGYNDLADNVPINVPAGTPAVPSVNSDGPGSLRNFVGSSGLGEWMLTETDNALLQEGNVNYISLTAYPQPPQTGFLVTLCGQEWFDDYVVVPDDATNVTISITYVSGTSQTGLFITNMENVSFSSYGVTPINAPGGLLTYSTTNTPPLKGGTWYYGIFNYGALDQDCVTLYVQVSFGLNQIPNLVQTFTNNTPIPLTTDGTVNNQICVSNGQQVIDVSVGVRLADTNLDDLVLQLTSPQGTSIVLYENRGGLLANNLGLSITNTSSVVTTNGTNSTIVTNYEYTVFTEDTNLTTSPIKFAPPPYAIPVTNPLTFLTTNINFDGASNGTYTVSNTIHGWIVETNEVTVTNNLSVTYDGGTNLGTNYLALAAGVLSQTFTTVPGVAYELRYYARSPGLTDWWPGDDNTIDLVGTNMGTIPYNDVTFDVGEVDRAFTFSGTGTSGDNALGNEVDFGVNTGNFGTNDFTVDFWIQQPGNSDFTYGVMQKKVDCSYNNSQWGIRSGTVGTIPGSLPGQLDLEVSSTGDINTSTFHCNKIINDGLFHHAAFTRSGTNLSIYIDGILDTNYSKNGIANISNAVPLRVGQNVCVGVDGTQPFIGEIDELDLWQRALTPAEINAIYEAGSLGKYSTNSLYPNFQVVFQGISSNDIIIPNFAEATWQSYTNSFVATNTSTTIEFVGNPLGVLLDDVQLAQLPYTNYDNYYLPEEPMTPLIGQNAQGCWTLSVWDTRTDSSVTNNGTLLSWTLQVTTSSSNAYFQILTDLSNNTYSTTAFATNLPVGGIFYFGVDVPPTANFATNMLLNAGGPMNLLFNQAALPTGTLPGDYTLLTLTGGNGTNTLRTQGAPPPLEPGERYFLGVQNTSAAVEAFTLEVQFDVSTNPIITTLTNGIILDPTVTTNMPQLYSITIPTNAVMATFQVTPTNGQVNLYAREGSVPTTKIFDYASLNQGTMDQFIVITTNSQPVSLPSPNPTNIQQLSPQTWYLAVYNPGTSPVGYSILATYVTNGPSGSPDSLDIINLRNYTNYTYYVTNTYPNGAPPGYPTNLLYSFPIPATSQAQVVFTVTNLSTNSSLELLVGNGVFPTPNDSYAGSFNGGTSNQIVVITTNATLPTLSATWYLAVVNTSFTNIKYSITASTNGLFIQPLTWDGAGGSTWNFTELDWRAATSPPDTTYNDNDPVTFDDTLTLGHNLITIASNVQPGGITFNNTVTNTYRFVGPGGLDGTNGLQVINTGEVILDNNASNTLSGPITITRGSLVIGNNDTNGTITASVTNAFPGTLAFNRTDNLSYAGGISGSGILLKLNTNVLTISTNNTNFAGSVGIYAGTLRLGATNALGFGSNTLIQILSGGTLDLNGFSGTNFVTAAGAGVNSNGAIVNNGAVPATPGLASVTLSGNTTIGGLQRWDLSNPGTNSYLGAGGQPYNLTKAGTNFIALVNTIVDPALANIIVEAGALDYVGSTTSLGNPTNILTLESNATLQFDDATNALNKEIVFDDGSTNFNDSGTNTIFGPVVLNTNAAGMLGTVTFNISGTSQLLTNVISGQGNLIITGGQPLYLAASNTYTGSTFITSNTVFLVKAGSIGLSSSVTIETNAIIDATGRADMTYRALSNQTIQGFGNINGALSISAGATVAPGASNLIGALTVSSNIVLAGTASFDIDNSPGGTNDILVSLDGSITYGGTLEVSNTSTIVYTNGQYFQLFSAASNMYFGGFSSLMPAQPSIGLYWYTNFLTVNGTIWITNAPVSLSLAWDGHAGSNWNYIEADWRPIALGLPDVVYSDTDTVTFDDSLTSGRNTIDIAQIVQPGNMTFSNSVTNTYTFVGPGGIAGITGLNLLSNGTVVLDNSGSNTFFGLITISNGTLQIGKNDTNGTIYASVTNSAPGKLVFNRSDNLSYGGVISGGGTLIKTNADILTLTGSNVNLHGPVDILQGTLRLGAVDALGAGSNAPVVISSGATLDLNSVPGTNFVTVTGVGVSNNGAIVNNGLGAAVPGISYLTMTSNTTIGGLQRWDLRNNNTNNSVAQPTNYSYLSTGGQPYNLTKVGPNVIGLVSCAVDPALAGIDIKAGTLDYQGSTSSLGNPANILTVETGATLEFYNATNGLNKVVVFNDGSTNFNAAGTNRIIGPVTLSTNSVGGAGTITFDIAGTSQLLSNVISGPGNLIVTGGQGLYLSASNTYTGTTLVNSGSVFLVGNGSIGTSSTVTISSNATIFVTLRGDQTLTILSGQTLQGFGEVVGKLAINAGGTLAPGTSTATGALLVSANVTLSGTSFFKIDNAVAGDTDFLASSLGSITYGGTLQLSNTTAVAYTNGESFELFSGGRGYAGAFTSIVPATPGPGLVWNTNKLNTSGTISVAAAAPPARPIFTSFTLSGARLVLSGTNGVPNGPYVVLTSTNLTQAWTPVETNNFSATGTFTFFELYSPTNQQQFFTIEQP